MLPLFSMKRKLFSTVKAGLLYIYSKYTTDIRTKVENIIFYYNNFMILKNENSKIFMFKKKNTYFERFFSKTNLFKNLYIKRIRCLKIFLNFKLFN